MKKRNFHHRFHRPVKVSFFSETYFWEKGFEKKNSERRQGPEGWRGRSKRFEVTENHWRRGAIFWAVFSG
jgi:hypothetical protein